MGRNFQEREVQHNLDHRNANLWLRRGLFFGLVLGLVVARRGLVVVGLHGGEEEHLLDVVRVRQEHGQSGNADKKQFISKLLT